MSRPQNIPLLRLLPIYPSSSSDFFSILPPKAVAISVARKEKPRNLSFGHFLKAFYIVLVMGRIQGRGPPSSESLKEGVQVLAQTIKHFRFFNSAIVGKSSSYAL